MYKDSVIHSMNLMDYEDYIPVNYHEQIQKGELTAMATFDGERDENRLVGVYVTGSHAGWMELVWVMVSAEYRSIVQIADYIRYILRKAKRTGNFVGAFAEIHADESTEAHLKAVILSGMEIRRAKNNIYEVTPEIFSREEIFLKAASNGTCIPIQEASENLLIQLEDMMDADERPIPVGAYVDWEECLQEISMVCIEENKPAGLMLFKEEKDYIVLELCYSASKTALATMIGTAITAVREQFSEDQKFLIPIVGKDSAPIIEKLFPNAQRGEILEACAWFEQKETSEAYALIKNKISGK